MTLPLADRLSSVQESATLKLNAAVQAMKAKGIDVTNLTAGEPDFQVPEEAQAAAIAAVRGGKSKYTPVPGIPELRDAIAAKTNAQQPSVAKSAPWKASDVIVTNGGKQALFNAFLAVLNPGDEVLIPAPYWLSYPEMVKIMGGEARYIHAGLDQDFKIRPAQLEAALTAGAGKTKILVLNSPSNPTGAMYSKSEFERLAQVLETHPHGKNVRVISDEIYDRIILGDTPFCSFLEAAPALRDRVITVNGMSKSAAMTGWRIGWSVTAGPITQAMNTLQGQCTSGINAPAQWASLAALKMPESAFAAWTDAYRKRRNLALEILRKARKIKVFVPEGAFYLFVGVGSYLKQGEDSIAFAERLLEGAKVAVVPGTPFGAPEYLRLSFPTDEQSLQEGCERLVRYLNEGEQDVQTPAPKLGGKG